MNRILAGVRDRENRYRIVKEKIGKNELYGDIHDIIIDSIEYKPDISLENEDSWYHIDDFNKQDYCIDLIREDYTETTNYVNISKNDLEIIKFLITYQSVTKNDGYIIFQKVLANRVLRNKKMLFFNNADDVEISKQSNEIIINDYPDAIYSISENRLYFKKLLNIESIFKGINELYREATNEEVENFMKSDFIITSADFSIDQVKVSNRKRIALVQYELKKLKEDDKKKIIKYTKKYCKQLKCENNKFVIENDKDLKSLLFGIQEKYYTTEVTNKRKCANSTIDLD